MKLSKIYSNKPFHNTTFITEKGGMNVIVGDSKGKQQGSNSHSLGKSKLVELLDFMLLKNVSIKKNFFFYNKEESKQKFAGYEFYLEILLNSGQYLTIKRTVDNDTKIAFKLTNVKSEGFIFYDTFDENLPIERAKDYLNKLLNLDFCKEKGESYRRLINYSLRTQGDYEPKMNTIFQLRKFAKNKDKDWKPLIFDLLGFDGKVLRTKYDLEESIKDETKIIKAQEKEIGIESENRDSLVGKIQNKEYERERLSEELNNLNFYQQDKETINALVGTIEEEIATLNVQLYNIEYDIKKLNNSIRNEFSFDLNKVKNLFDEVEIHFSDQLAKTYEQLITFNHQITKERNTQVRQTLKEKQQEETEINNRLIDLNQRKEQFRSIIQDTSLFKKYNTYQKQLIEIERNLSRFQTQLERVDEIEQKKTTIEDTQNNELQNIKNQVKEIIDNTAKCSLYMDIRKTFSDIVKQILNETALITISRNSTYNIDFKPEFPNSAKDEGATYYKILCIAFDLSILINYRSKSHLRFVYHDDVVSGDDNGIKTRLINTVREICKQHDIQYIFSTIKDNIPPNIDLSENTILYLNDKDDFGKLFKMTF